MEKKLQNQQYLKYRCHLAHQTHYFLFFSSGDKQHAKENSFCVWSFLCINIFYNFLRHHFNSVQKKCWRQLWTIWFFSKWMALLCDSNSCQFYQAAELFHLLNSAYFINLKHALDHLLVFQFIFTPQIIPRHPTANQTYSTIH